MVATAKVSAGVEKKLNADFEGGCGTYAITTTIGAEATKRTKAMNGFFLPTKPSGQVSVRYEWCTIRACCYVRMGVCLCS